MMREGRPAEKPAWQGTMLVSMPEGGGPPLVVFFMGRVPMDPDIVQIEVGRPANGQYVFRPPAGTEFTEVRLEGEEVALIAPLPTGCRFLASLLPLGPGSYATPQQVIRGRLYSVRRGSGWTWCGGLKQ